MTARFRISLDDLTPNNLGVLRRINSVVLPTTYSDTWYKDSLKVGELAKLGMLKKFFLRANLIY